MKYSDVKKLPEARGVIHPSPALWRAAQDHMAHDAGPTSFIPDPYWRAYYAGLAVISSLDTNTLVTSSHNGDQRGRERDLLGNSG